MNQPILWFGSGVLAVAVTVCAYAGLRRPSMSELGYGPSNGMASFYGVDTNGTTTASGIPLNDSAFTAAHRTLPFGSTVRVTNVGNGMIEMVTITDRGPFVQGRIIDVSRNAAEKLGMIESGVVLVKLDVMDLGTIVQEIAMDDD